jgi:hypothetical protein
MNKGIDDVLILNGPMLIRVVGHEITLNVHQSEVKIPYQPINIPNDIKKALVHRKGNMLLEVTSDIFDVEAFRFKDHDFDRDTIKALFKALLLASIQFIAKVSVDEDNAILIQNTYIENQQYFLSTIGVLDDALIIFAEIKVVTNPLKGKERKHA